MPRLLERQDRFERVLGSGRGGRSGVVDARDEGAPPRDLGPQREMLFAMLREACPPTKMRLGILFSLRSQASLTDYHMACSMAAAGGRSDVHTWMLDAVLARTGPLDNASWRAVCDAVSAAVVWDRLDEEPRELLFAGWTALFGRIRPRQQS